MERLIGLIGTKWSVGVRTLVSRHADLILCLAITSIAAFLRLYRLGEIPPGLHGDEAWTGLDARRVLEEGWFGPYTSGALGQPSGPMYWAAPWVALLGDTVWAVRVPMALLGIATVALAYVAFRLMFGRFVAVTGAAFLATSSWLLHYNRTGFTVSAGPVMEVLTLALLFAALHTRRPVLFGLTGLALGLGVYGYFGFVLFAVGFFLFLLLKAFLDRGLPPVRYGLAVAQIAVVALLVALPMRDYFLSEDQGYRHDRQTFALTGSREYQEAEGSLAKLNVIKGRTREVFDNLVLKGWPDASDGAGFAAALDPAVAILAGIGVAYSLYALVRFRDSRYALSLIMIGVIALGAVLTVSGSYRRSLPMVPFTTLLAVLPLNALWVWANRNPGALRWLVLLATALIIAVSGYRQTAYYFGTFPDTRNTHFTFGEEIAEASEYLTSLPVDTYVYFYSNRWSYNYETRRYLASDYAGEDRSDKFGTFSLDNSRPRSQPVVYVLLPDYTDYMGDLLGRYPGGILTDSKTSAGRVLFSAYYLPAERYGEASRLGADTCVLLRAVPRNRRLMVATQKVPVTRQDRPRVSPTPAHWAS